MEREGTSLPLSEPREKTMYYQVTFLFKNSPIGVRVWSYVGEAEAIAIARGWLTDPESPFVSCKVCPFN